MVLNNKIYDQIESGNFDQDQGEIREKARNFISHSECQFDWNRFLFHPSSTRVTSDPCFKESEIMYKMQI